MREIVVCIHGTWMKGWVMMPISRYLSRHGHECRRFSYQSLRHSPERSAQILARFVDRLDADLVHFVAHSFGGVVLLYYFQWVYTARPGRVVMLGTPLRGSGCARYLAGNNFTKNLTLGESAESLLGNAPKWKGGRPLAIFAGTRSRGVGRMLGVPLDDPNDGTVAVSETKTDNCTLHVQIPYSHTGMLFSRSVAAFVDEFLRTGSIT